MRRLVIFALAVVLVVCVATIAASTPGKERTKPASTAGTRAPVVLMLGDSYTMGVWRIKPEQTFAAGTARTLGWQIVFAGHSGTGFVETGRIGKTFSMLFDEQLAWRPPPDMVVVSGGHNDWRYPPDEVAAAARELIAKVRKRWPKTHLLLMGPLWGGDPPPAPLAVRDALRGVATSAGVPFVDPLQEQWITGNVRRRTGNAQTYIRPDGIHPNPIGNAYFAERFVASLKALGLDRPIRGRAPTPKHTAAGGSGGAGGPGAQGANDGQGGVGPPGGSGGSGGAGDQGASGGSGTSGGASGGSGNANGSGDDSGAPGGAGDRGLSGGRP